MKLCFYFAKNCSWNAAGVATSEGDPKRSQKTWQKGDRKMKLAETEVEAVDKVSTGPMFRKLTNQSRRSHREGNEKHNMNCI